VECLEAALRIHLKHREVTFKDLTLPLKDDIQLANAFSNLGVIKKQAGNYEEAASLHDKCIAIKMKYPLDQMAFLLALSYDNLGRVRELQGDLEAAATLFAQGYGLFKGHSKEIGTQHRMAQFTCSLGRVEAKLGQNIQAQSHLLESLELFRESVGAFHSDAGLAWYHLGSLMLKEGAIEEAM
jgi:tetratricopeptide (TPR) repeat protein